MVCLSSCPGLSHVRGADYRYALLVAFLGLEEPENQVTSQVTTHADSAGLSRTSPDATAALNCGNRT